MRNHIPQSEIDDLNRRNHAHLERTKHRLVKRSWWWLLWLFLGVAMGIPAAIILSMALFGR